MRSARLCKQSQSNHTNTESYEHTSIRTELEARRARLTVCAMIACAGNRLLKATDGARMTADV